MHSLYVILVAYRRNIRFANEPHFRVIRILPVLLMLNFLLHKKLQSASENCGHDIVI
jgi:hypothetical protein